VDGNSAIHILMFHATYQVVGGASRCVRTLSAKDLVRWCLCARPVQSLRAPSAPRWQQDPRLYACKPLRAPSAQCRCATARFVMPFQTASPRPAVSLCARVYPSS